MNTHLSEDFCLYRSQFGYPYPGLFNPLRCNYEYALTGSDNEGSKKQEETKKRREKKRMSQLMYSDTRRQRLNERLRLKLENRKTNDDEFSKNKNSSETSCLSEQDLLSLFDTSGTKEIKKKKKKKKRKKKKEKEKVVLIKEEEMELLEEEMLGTTTSLLVASAAAEEEPQKIVEQNEKEQETEFKNPVIFSPLEEDLESHSTGVQGKEESLNDMEEKDSIGGENNSLVTEEDEEEKSCGETNSIESAGNVTERGSLSVEENQEQDVNILGADEFDPAWLLYMSDHEREDDKADNDVGFVLVSPKRRKEKKHKENKKPVKQYRKRMRRRRDREGRNSRKRRQRNNDDKKNEKSAKNKINNNNNNNQTSPSKIINSCPIKQISSNRQQPIFIPQQHVHAPSIPSIIQEEKEKEKFIENEPTPSESETTQYFIMPIPETPEPRTHQEKCDPTLIQQDFSSPHQSASTSKSPSPTRPPPGFETAPVVPQAPPMNATIHYQQINPQMINMCHYPQQINYEQQPHHIMVASPTHLTPAAPPEVPMSKPFQYQQMDSVMYLYLPSEQVLKIPMCPEERCAEEKYRMNLDLSFPVSSSEIPQPTYYFPVMPMQQNGVFLYPEQQNMISTQPPPEAAYMVSPEPATFMPYLNPEEVPAEMFTPMMYAQ